MDVPYPWAPKIVPLQILGVGQLVIIAVPGEFTTMSGRRLRNAVAQVSNLWSAYIRKIDVSFYHISLSSLLLLSPLTSTYM